MRKQNIDSKIMGYLKRIPFSATTEMVAKDVGIAWYTAQMHLHRLEKKGKVRYFKIGRQNQWILSSRLR